MYSMTETLKGRCPFDTDSLILNYQPLISDHFGGEPSLSRRRRRMQGVHAGCENKNWPKVLSPIACFVSVSLCSRLRLWFMNDCIPSPFTLRCVCAKEKERRSATKYRLLA